MKTEYLRQRPEVDRLENAGRTSDCLRRTIRWDSDPKIAR